MDVMGDNAGVRSTASRLRPWLSLAAIGYFVALFIGTHMPRLPTGISAGLSDKHLHFLAYGGLAFLLAARAACSRPVTARILVKLWLLLGVYGALDELLQIPVGRDAEILDWVMDVTGAASGLLACAITVWWFEQRVKPSRPEPASPPR
jgi:hypothetical protein